MATILDYLDEHGDTSFAEEAFCEVDALVLSQLAYLDLDGVVPAMGENDFVRLHRAAQVFFRIHTKDEIYGAGGLASPLTPFVLQKMAEGQRFGGARLMSYESCLEEGRHEQFCALVIDLGADVGLFVAFRGTDDTLLGWREDFEMSFDVVASQRDALAYLELIAEQNPQRLLYVGAIQREGTSLFMRLLARRNRCAAVCWQCTTSTDRASGAACWGAGPGARYRRVSIATLRVTASSEACSAMGRRELTWSRMRRASCSTVP